MERDKYFKQKSSFFFAPSKPLLECQPVYALASYRCNSKVFVYCLEITNLNPDNAIANRS